MPALLLCSQELRLCLLSIPRCESLRGDTAGTLRLGGSLEISTATSRVKHGAGSSWPCPAILKISVDYVSRITGSCSTNPKMTMGQINRPRGGRSCSDQGWSSSEALYGTLAPFCFPSGLQSPTAWPWLEHGRYGMNRGS